MFRRTIAVTLAGAMTLGVFIGPSAQAATKKKSPKKPVVTAQKSTPTADAREVELFEAMEAGEIEARVVPRDQFGAKVFIENKTDEPLNVKFPKAVVATPILAQFGGMGGGGMGGGGMGGMGGGGMGGMGGGGMGGGGGQSMGGGMGGGGMGGMGGGGMGGMGGGMGGMGGGGGGGFFSVPPEKIVTVQLNTICLEHGKDDPHSRMKYKLVPVEVMTNNSVLPELLSMVGTGKLDKNAAQAAAWHLTDRMSWMELASKEQQQIGGTIAPYFNRDELVGAQQILTFAMQRAEKNAADGNVEGQQPTPRKSPRVSQLQP